MSNQLRDGSSERFLVTGAHGCIGAWAVHQLLNEDVYVVAPEVRR